MTEASSEALLQSYRIPGAIDLLIYPIRKFKTTLVNILLHRPLDERSSAAALIPYLLRRGTRSLPSMAAISRHLERLFGASLDVEVLRYGERQILSFRMDVVDDRYLLMGGRDLLRHALELLLDILTAPALDDRQVFSDEVFGLERLNLRRFVESIEDDKGRYAIDRCMRHMFDGEPYARLEYGEPEEIDSLDPEEVTALWREILLTAPMEIYVVGSADPDAVRRAVSALFGTLRDGSAIKEPPATVLRKAGRIRRIRESGDLVQARLVMGYRTGEREKLGAALTVWNTILGGGTFSRLFRHVRERHSLAYYCSSSVDHSKGVAFVMAGMDASMADRVERIVRRQLSELRRGRIELDELRAAKAWFRSGLLSMRDSPARIAGFLQERRVAGRPLSFEEAHRRIARIRRDDVRRAAETVKLDTVYLLADGKP